MGLENRDYLRDEARRYGGDGGFMGGGPSAGSHAPMCRRILIITIAVFVCQLIATRDWTAEELQEKQQRYIEILETYKSDYGDPNGDIGRQIQEVRDAPLNPYRLGLTRKTSPVQNWFQLETPKVFSGQIWRLVTCAFCHSRSDLWHILMNMLFLWWFGPRLEALYGSKEFLLFYLTSALVASISYIGLDLITGDPIPMVGASGAIMAVLTLFAMHYPQTVIYVMFILPVEVRWIVAFYAVMDLFPILQTLGGETPGDNVAHAAHLGGLAFGYIYGAKRLRLSPAVSDLQMWWKRKKSGFKVVSASSGSATRSQRLADDMDAILKKISEEGEASLTPAERKTLECASRELRDRKS